MDKIVSRKKMIGWALYQAGLSPYHGLIVTYVFAAYFISKIAYTHVYGIAMIGYATSISALLTAIGAIFLGSIADRVGRFKYWLALCAGIMVIASVALFFSYPSPKYIYWSLVWLGLGLLFYNLSAVFHNSLLAHTFSSRHIAKLSGWGLASSFFGGILSLLLMLLISYIIKQEVPLSHSESLLGRMSGIVVAIWVVIFTLPFFLRCDDVGESKLSTGKIHTISRLLLVLRQYPNVSLFQLARLFYNAGLWSIINFLALYMVSQFKLGNQKLMLYAISVGAMSGFSSFFYGRIERNRSPKKILLSSIGFLVVISIVVLMMTNLNWFWIFSCIAAIAPGVILSCSRSFLCQLSPKEHMATVFGFSSLVSQLALALGPLLLAFTTRYFNSARAGIFSAVSLIIIGWVLLLQLKEPRFIVGDKIGD